MFLNLVPSFAGLIDQFSFNIAMREAAFWLGVPLVTVAVLLPVQAVRWYEALSAHKQAAALDVTLRRVVVGTPQHPQSPPSPSICSSLLHND